MLKDIFKNILPKSVQKHDEVEEWYKEFDFKYKVSSLIDRNVIDSKSLKKDEVIGIIAMYKPLIGSLCKLAYLNGKGEEQERHIMIVGKIAIVLGALGLVSLAISAMVSIIN